MGDQPHLSITIPQGECQGKTISQGERKMTTTEKPESLDRVWTERELCEKLGLRIKLAEEGTPGDRDRSRQLGSES
jgi:hypothetical protein